MDLLEGISIHAPSWGATCTFSKLRDVRGISIHAPSWGATMHVEGYAAIFEISIHAPSWGATRIVGTIVQTAIDFNPRTLVGCDGHAENSSHREAGFQSTHPRGVRLYMEKI